MKALLTVLLTTLLLGVTSTDARGAPVATAAIMGGRFHSLALSEEGIVYAWGDDERGQLGNDQYWYHPPSDRYPSGYYFASPMAVPIPGVVTAIATSNYADFNLALDSDGTVWAWGDNSHGQIGNGTSGNSVLHPGQVSYLQNVTKIGAGSRHGLAATQEGADVWVWGWGDNSSRQLGPLQQRDYLYPGLILQTGLPVLALAGGDRHSLMLKGDHTVWAWGANDHGQLGNNTTTDSLLPVKVQMQLQGAVGDLTDVIAIAAGYEHNLAIRSDHTVWAWGANTYGQLGDNAAGDRCVAVQVLKAVPGHPPLTGVTAIAAGEEHSLAVLSNSTICAWGNCFMGQLGIDVCFPGSVGPYDYGTAMQVYRDGAHDYFVGAESVGAGSGHSLEVGLTGSVHAWGLTSRGQTAIMVPEDNPPTWPPPAYNQPWIPLPMLLVDFCLKLPPDDQPVATITSTMPPFIYEGWTVNMTATASGGTPPLTYRWTQTTGQPQTLTGATTLNASFTVPAKSLTSEANELLTFQFVATDSGTPPLSSIPVTTSVHCYLCGDIDHDHTVILYDLKLLVAAWNSTPTSPKWNLAADLDGDHAVILADLKLLVANWNRYYGSGASPDTQELATDAETSLMDSLDPDTDLVNFKLLAVDPTTGLEVSSVRATTTQPVEVHLYAQCPTSGLWAVGGDIVADGPAGTLTSSDQQFSWTVSRGDDQPLWQWTGSEWTQSGSYPYYNQGGNFGGDVPVPQTETELHDGQQHVTSYSYSFTDMAACAAQASPVTIDNWFKGGVPGPNGGMTCLGSGQGAITNPSASFGSNGYVLLGSYTVSVLDDTQSATLTWQEGEQDSWSICEYYGGWYTSGTQGLYTQIGTISPLKINWPSVTPGAVPPFVYEGWTVNLTASGFSPAGYTLTYSWTQTGGAAVTDLTVDPATGNASFTVPTVELTSDVPLKFTVTVDDGHNHTASAEVTINAYIMGDVTHDNVVNSSDTQALTSVWNSGPGYTGPADLDRDGYVNLADLKIINPNWGRTLSDVAITITGNPSYIYEGQPVSLGCTIRSIHGDTPSYTWTQTAGAAVVNPSGADTASYSFTVPTLTYTSDLPLTFTLSVNAGQDGIATKTFQVAAYMLGDINHNNIVNNTGIGNDYSAVHYAADPASYPGDARWNAAADFNGDGVIDSSDESLVPSWNRTLTSPISLTIGDVPSFVYETWPVSLTCSATSARNDTLTYVWTQIWGPAVSLSGADTSSISFTVPTLQILDDEWLGFSVTVTDGHGGSITSDDIWVDAWMMGDVNHDYYVDSNDTAAVTAAWGTYPGETNWNAWADLNNDGTVNQSDQDLVDSNLDRYLDYFMQGMSVSLNSSAVLSDQQVDGAVAQPSTTGPVDTYGLTFEQALQQAGLLQEWLNYLSTQGSGQ